MAEAKTLTAEFSSESTAENSNPKGKPPWTRTYGFVMISVPCFITKDAEVGRDILPFMSGKVKDLYIQYRDAQNNARAKVASASSVEERAFYRGQVAILDVIRSNFQATQRSNRGLVQYRLAPENTVEVEGWDTALEASIERRKEEVAAAELAAS